MLFESLRHACPEAFRDFALRAARPLAWSAMALLGAGLGVALLLAPTNPAQGDAFRIAAIHYPAAWVALGAYLAIGTLSALTLRYHSRLTAMLAGALAPTGMLFTLLALWTEALWRRPVRGTWWAWNAEVVSQLMLLFLLGGFVALRFAIDDPRRADRACALLALIGLGNLPILYFSLHWWDVIRYEAPMSTPPMSAALMAAAALIGAGFAAYAASAALKRVRCFIAERDALARSLRRLLESPA